MNASSHPVASSARMQDAQRALNELYRSESPRLLAVLVRLFGPHNLELAEDVLQDAFGKAIGHWSKEGVPNEPAAWVYRTAKNAALDAIRGRSTQTKFADDLSHFLESEWTLSQVVEREFGDSAIQDDQLRMIFMCCRPDIPTKNRLPLILKSLCGLSIPAIARALLLSEANVKKRLLRTRAQLREVAFSLPSDDEVLQAMDSVHTALYLVFNEGYYSSDAKHPMRLDLCRNAMALTELLIQAPKLVNKDTLGLAALMHYLTARAPARLAGQDTLVPLDRQDRARWSRDETEVADRLLSMTQWVIAGASGRFFLEAQIAAEHSRAPSFTETNWERIVERYATLHRVTRSPVVALNWAIALGYSGDPEAGVECVREASEHGALKRSHQASATLAHLVAMAGDAPAAAQYVEEARERGATERELHLIKDQVARLLARK